MTATDNAVQPVVQEVLQQPVAVVSAPVIPSFDDVISEKVQRSFFANFVNIAGSSKTERKLNDQVSLARVAYNDLSGRVATLGNDLLVAKGQKEDSEKEVAAVRADLLKAQEEVAALRAAVSQKDAEISRLTEENVKLAAATAKPAEESTFFGNLFSTKKA